MDNVKVTRQGNKLTLEIDLSKKLYRTQPHLNKFGKMSTPSDVYATSHGNATLEGGYKLGINIFKPVSDDGGVTITKE